MLCSILLLILERYEIRADGVKYRGKSQAPASRKSRNTMDEDPRDSRYIDLEPLLHRRIALVGKK